MFLRVTASLLTLLLALEITGSPVKVHNSPIILPLTKRLNVSNGTFDLVQHDEARVAAFRDYHTHGRRDESIPVLFAGWGKYTVALRVGSPPTTYNLIVDTGSAVTWINSARTSYRAPGVNTGQCVGQTYGGTKGGRTIFLDTVTLGGGLTIPNYELAVASTSRNIRYDGILGLGPRDLTADTRANPGTYPTFTDCLFNTGVIRHNLVGIFFQPMTRDGDSDVGELAFGEPDYTKCTNDIIYTPITDTSPSADYWGIDQSITYGGTEILEKTAGIIDTGTIYIKIASDAYDKYQAATGATFDKPTGLLRVTPDQYDALHDLKFHISDDDTLSLIPNAQIWPRFLNHKLPGGEDNGIYLIVTRLPPGSSALFDFIAGYTFMQRFYTVLDGSIFGVGFATTQSTTAIIN
ncbi:aspartic peptidase A1 [Suillus spraguei]|nr:aspartic peptidase A1 [Suillus spraguei]